MKHFSAGTMIRFGRLAILGAALIWGTSFVILKSALDAIPTFYLLAIRFTVGTLILLIPCAKHLKRLDGRTILGGLAMGSCLFWAYIFQTFGLIGTTPGKNAFLSTTYCLLVPFLYWLFRKQKPSRCTFAAAIICLVGIGLVSLDGDLHIGTGDLLTLISGFFFALHIIVVYSASQNQSPLLMTMLQFFFAALFCWCGGLLFEAFPQHIPTDAILRLAYLCVFATCITLLLQSFGQKYCDPSSVAILLTLESVFGAVFSIILGERPAIRTLIGFVLIFAAVLISETRLSFLQGRKRKKQ